MSRHKTPHRAGRAGRRRGAVRDPLAGWPTGQYSPITPAGENEQIGKLLSGLARQRGWRLVVARVAAVVLLLIIVALLLTSVLNH